MPGSVDKCPICDQVFFGRQKRLKCKGCQIRSHIVCLGVSEDEYLIYAKSKNYRCTSCMSIRQLIDDSTPIKSSVVAVDNDADADDESISSDTDATISLFVDNVHESVSNENSVSVNINQSNVSGNVHQLQQRKLDNVCNVNKSSVCNVNMSSVRNVSSVNVNELNACGNEQQLQQQNLCKVKSNCNCNCKQAFSSGISILQDNIESLIKKNVDFLSLTFQKQMASVVEEVKMLREENRGLRQLLSKVKTNTVISVAGRFDDCSDNQTVAEDDGALLINNNNQGIKKNKKNNNKRNENKSFAAVAATQNKNKTNNKNSNKNHLDTISTDKNVEGNFDLTSGLCQDAEKNFVNIVDVDNVDRISNVKVNLTPAENKSAVVNSWTTHSNKRVRKGRIESKEGTTSNSAIIKRKRSTKFTIGQNNSKIDLVKPKMKAIFVTRFNTDVQEKDISNLLENNNFKTLNCIRLKTKYNSYNSFRVEVVEEDFEKLCDPNVWPTGTFLSPFYGPLRKETIYYSINPPEDGSVQNIDG